MYLGGTRTQIFFQRRSTVGGHQGARFDCLVRLISDTDLVRLPNGLGENILLFLVQTVGRQLVEHRQYRPSRYVVNALRLDY
jgi:E3 ubiquitin-protein ligase EDD1